MSDPRTERQAEQHRLEQQYAVTRSSEDQTVRLYGLAFHAPVFVVASALLLLFLLGALLFADTAQTVLDAVLGWIRTHFDGLFLVAGNVFLLGCLVLMVSPLGRVRIGGVDARPDFSLISWLTMLFAAGMGIGLVFWAVAEPVAYYTAWMGAPLGVEAGTPEAARIALGATMYHWGLHPWAIYSVMALALAFFSFNKGLPLTVRSALYPLLGERTWGVAGHLVDILAIVATTFGLATSLGLGAQQAASGLSYVFPAVPDNFVTQLVIIAIVTLAAVISVLRGIGGGIRVLSNINLSLAGLLLVFVIAAGGVAAFAVSLTTAAGSYLADFLALSNPVGREDETFLQGWTVFYLAWWIAWSPFVGMFIARVSRGRTVRQFLVAVLVAPALATLVWVSALGGEGLEQVRTGAGSLAAGLGSRESMALFHMLGELPWGSLSGLIAVVLVVVFFVTSSDSGSLVIDAVSAGGRLDTPDAQRVFWVVLMGALAAVLLFIGGEAALDALQAGTVAAGLPFSLALLAIGASLVQGLRHERRLMALKGEGPPARERSPAVETGQTGLPRPAAAAIAYLGGPVTGAALLLLERRDPAIRFHAVQSLLLSAVITAVWAIAALLGAELAGAPAVFWLSAGLLLYRAALAWQGKWARVPLPGAGPRRLRDRCLAVMGVPPDNRDPGP